MVDKAPAHEKTHLAPEYIDNPNNGELMAVRFDVHELLEAKIGQDWQEQLMAAVDEEGAPVVRVTDHWTCREADPETKVSLVTLTGTKAQQLVPGLWELYLDDFKEQMVEALGMDAGELNTYDDPEPALECVSQEVAEDQDDVQRRMESHVDMRFTAVLVIKEPNSDEEGRLVISNNPDAQSVEEIDQDATRIAHRAGTLVCFVRGGKYPHYTEEIAEEGSRRVVVSLNYPKGTETPEETQKLHDHILGKVL